MNKINSLLKALNINYKNLDFYVEAFTHSSFNNDFSYDKNYQRLEFLGDAILQKHITSFLFINFQKANEGQMTLLRSRFVKKETLSQIAEELKLGQYIRFGKSIHQISNNLLEDVFEALIGAIYMDKGAIEVEKFLHANLYKEIKKASITNNKNPKTILQEYLQSESRENIYYQVQKVTQGFKASVFHDNNLFGIGIGATKKQAEVGAAIDALERLSNNNETN